MKKVRKANVQEINFQKLYEHGKSLFVIEDSFDDILKDVYSRIGFVDEIISKLDELEDGEDKDTLIIYLNKTIDDFNMDENSGIKISRSTFNRRKNKILLPSSLDEIELFFDILHDDLEIIKEKGSFSFNIPLDGLYDGIRVNYEFNDNNFVHLLGLTKTDRNSFLEETLEVLKKRLGISGMISADEGIDLIYNHFDEYKEIFIGFYEEVKKWHEEFLSKHSNNGYEKAYKSKFGNKYFYFYENLMKVSNFFNFINLFNLQEVIMDYESEEVHDVRRSGGKASKDDGIDIYLLSYDMDVHQDTINHYLSKSDPIYDISMVGFAGRGFELAEKAADGEAVDDYRETIAKTGKQVSIKELIEDYYKYSHSFLIDKVFDEDHNLIFLSSVKRRISYLKNNGDNEESLFLQNLLKKLNNKWGSYLKNYNRQEYKEKANIIREKLSLYQEFLYYLETEYDAEEIDLDVFICEVHEWYKKINYVNLQDENIRGMIQELVCSIMEKHYNYENDNRYYDEKKKRHL